ncbi:CU044_2847 family protein [Nocardia sp. NPDC003693]
MAHIERVEMPDGTVIFARIEAVDEAAEAGLDGGAGADVGLRDTLRLENLGSTVRSVAASVHAGLDGMKPDRVAIEFGLELAFTSGGVFAVLASGGAKASVKVALEWEPAAATA